MSLKPKVSRNNVLNQMVDEIGILGLKTSKLGSRDREGDCEVFFLQETELKWYLMYKLQSTHYFSDKMDSNSVDSILP